MKKGIAIETIPLKKSEINIMFLFLYRFRKIKGIKINGKLISIKNAFEKKGIL